MLLTGNMKPDNRIVGMKIRNVTMNACCWVRDTVEISSPRPRLGSR